MSAEEEQRLADLLKHAVPQPPRELTDEEITTVHVNLPRKSWLMPALAAAAVIIIGGGAGALAATSSGNSGPPATPGTSRTTLASPTARPSSSATPIPTKIAVVPAVVGMPLAQAASVIQSAGYSVRVVQEARPGVPLGTVWATNPPAGTALSTVANVTIYVTPVPPTATPTPSAPGTPTPSITAVPTPGSGSTGKAVVASLLGMSMAQAEQVIQAQGLKASVIQETPPAGEHLPPGMVWGQTPDPGSSVPLGTIITLYVVPRQ